MKTDEKLPHIGNKNLILFDCISEQEYADLRGVTLRTCQRDRQLRISPPYIAFGKKIYYRIEALKNWLLKREFDFDTVKRSRSHDGKPLLGGTK